MLGSPTEMLGWMLAVIVIGFLVCSLGLQTVSYTHLDVYKRQGSTFSSEGPMTGE